MFIITWSIILLNKKRFPHHKVNFIFDFTSFLFCFWTWIFLKNSGHLLYTADPDLYVHGVVKKTGCEKFVINFEDNANQVVSGVPPKRLRPLKKTPHRLKVRPREQVLVQEQQQQPCAAVVVQRPFTATNVGHQVNKKEQNNFRKGLRSAAFGRTTNTASLATATSKSSRGKKMGFFFSREINLIGNFFFLG